MAMTTVGQSGIDAHYTNFCQICQILEGVLYTYSGNQLPVGFSIGLVTVRGPSQGPLPWGVQISLPWWNLSLFPPRWRRRAGERPEP